MTEQGSIHCNCQPPINIPLLQGNPRSSRDLQFTQLRSMWTKPCILSLSLFFLPLHYPIPALHFPITSPLVLLLCVFHIFLLTLEGLIVFSYLLSPAIRRLLCPTVLSVMYDLPPCFEPHISFCLSPLIDIVVTHWIEFSNLLRKQQ